MKLPPGMNQPGRETFRPDMQPNITQTGFLLNASNLLRLKGVLMAADGWESGFHQFLTNLKLQSFHPTLTDHWENVQTFQLQVCRIIMIKIE